MNQNDLFLIAALRLFGFVVVGIVLACASCTGYQSHKVSEIQARGVDPIAAHCAIHGNTANRTVCDVYLAKGKP
jgi:hypothetical protein